MFYRTFSVTIRDQQSKPIEGALVSVNEEASRTSSSGRATLNHISSDWHQVQLTIDAAGFDSWSESVNLDPSTVGNVSWPDLYLIAANTAVEVDSDHFVINGDRWIWRGSTDFRLIEVVLNGGPAAQIIQDRKDSGANLLRVLSMKADNTGWELDPRGGEYWDAVRETIDLIHEFGLKVELTVFADTKRMLASQADQLNHWRACADVSADFLELINEAGHPTQQCNPAAFAKHSNVLCSHGSSLSDVQPVKPFWDYATYHGRRSGSVGKISSNYSPYVFQDTFPTPVPFIPEETIKPASYGHSVQVARHLGKSACCGAGGTFHHDAWNEPRLFNDAERACAEAFYEALND